jgi:serine protease Do
VTEVDPNGVAAAQGLRPGDVILEVGGKQVHGMGEVKDALKASGKKRVLMLVRSGDSQRFVALPVEQG